MSTGDELTSRGERSKDAILDAAEKLLGERGYAATSISAICAAAGLPPSSVYWHFASKAGVLAAVVERMGARFLREFGAPDTTGANSDERLEKLLTAIAVLAATTSSNLHFLMVLGLREGQATELTTAVLRRVRGHIVGWLREQLTDIFELADRPGGVRLAGELATLVAAVANGVQIAGWEERTDAPFPVRQLKIALIALAADDQMSGPST